MAISNFTDSTAKALKDQNAAKTDLDNATASVTRAKETLDKYDNLSDAEKVAQKANYDKAKVAYQNALKLERDAQTEYKNKANIYTTKSEENNQAQKVAYTTYTDKLNKIDAMAKTMKNETTAAQKANLKALNKKDKNIELAMNELNVQKDMIKAERDNAKSAVEQQASDLAPKY
jgi:hypothetical protein